MGKILSHALVALVCLGVGLGLGLVGAKQGWIGSLGSTNTPVESANQPSSGPQTQALAPIESIAVLPFACDPEIYNQVKDKIDSFNENLPKLLAANTSLRVTPPAEIEALKDKTNPLGIGEKLGVDAVLSGKITLSGHLLEIEAVTANLLEVKTGVNLWSKTFVLREPKEEIRLEVFSKLQQVPGQINQELKKRWPKKK